MYWLVVQPNPSEKYESVNWDDEIPNINGKIKLMATKPPTSLLYNTLYHRYIYDHCYFSVSIYKDIYFSQKSIVP